MAQGNPKGARGERRNKGIAAAHKQRKREEAEARNAQTKPENRRAFRRDS